MRPWQECPAGAKRRRAPPALIAQHRAAAQLSHAMPMKRIIFTCVALFVTRFSAADEPLQCDVGPITKTFGSVPWLVYACRDGKSLVVVSTPGSPAAPFYFSFSPEHGGYHLRGEGTGSKKVTDAALEDLKRLSDDNVRALVHEAQAEKK
jgi:hypothetical protein